VRIGVLGTVMIEAGNLRAAIAECWLRSSLMLRLGALNAWATHCGAAIRRHRGEGPPKCGVAASPVLGSAISFGPGGYRLDVPSEDVDVRRFETLVELAEQVMRPIPPRRIVISTTPDSCGGEPYSDLRRWAHALGTIRRLEARRSVSTSCGSRFCRRSPVRRCVASRKRSAGGGTAR
jgi:hypothetical protein